FASWLEIRIIVRRGRAITWQDALGRCKAGPAVIVVEPKSRPRRVWFLAGSDDSAFFSRKGNPRFEGLLIIDPPDQDRLSEEVKSAGGRVAEVDMNATLW
ncbi:MAG: hypothetical protein WCL11_19185, partial [Verrucomicrobiota bacterium]